jgi:hypothetical protein
MVITGYLVDTAIAKAHGRAVVTLLEEKIVNSTDNR